MARVLPDVDERHVAAAERDEQDDRRDEGHRERREQRVLRRQRQPPLPLPRGIRTGDQRVRDQAEGEEECGAPERRHYVLADFAGVYFEGHFVISEPRFATKTPL